MRSLKRLMCKLLGHDVSFERGVPLVISQLGAFFPPEETGTFVVCHRCGQKVRCDWCDGRGRTLSDEKCGACG